MINKDSTTPPPTTTATTTTSSNSINNGTNIYLPSRRVQPQQTPPTSTTSESMNMETSPSTLSNNTNSITAPSPNSNQWRHKLTNLKQTFQNVGTPRFHRRPKVLCKLHLILSLYTHAFPSSISVTESDSTTTSYSPSQYGTTPEATKKSLFHHIIDAMQEDHHMIVVKDRPLSAIKTDLIHAFLSVS